MKIRFGVGVFIPKNWSFHRVMMWTVGEAAC